MGYFKDIKLEDKIYSLVYGEGTVNFVLDEKVRTEGFYIFQVEYNNGKVYYTEDGVPEWCNEFCTQTVFYKDDLDIPESDFTRVDTEMLSMKKIVKFKEQDKLEMRAPSGAWRNVNQCPPKEFLDAIKNEKFYLFRKI